MKNVSSVSAVVAWLVDMKRRSTALMCWSLVWCAGAAVACGAQVSPQDWDGAGVGTPDSAQPDAPVDANVTPDAPVTPDATPPFSCDDQPTFPISYNTLSGFTGAEDFAFDADGHLVSAASGNLMRQTKTGPQMVFVPGIGSTAGTRFLPNGDLIIANVGEGSLQRVSPAGSVVTVLSGIAYPNGVEVDSEGWVYVAEQNAGNVRRVNPDTGDFEIIGSGMSNPNGVSFSPDYRTLYVGSFGAGVVYKIRRDGVGGWHPATVHGQITPGGGLDGVAVDVCGYIYVTEFGPGTIWRLPPDEGQPPELVVTLPSSWIPNMHWGPGQFDWDKNALYVIDRSGGALYELLLGIPEKPKVYPN